MVVEMAIDKGDVVLLKSGGATMVVTETDYDHDQVLCVWQNPLPKGGFSKEQSLYPRIALVLKSEKDAEYLKGLKDLSK